MCVFQVTAFCFENGWTDEMVFSFPRLQVSMVFCLFDNATILCHRWLRARLLFLLYVCNGPLARYVKLRVAHAPGMPGTFFPSTRVSDPDVHHGTCVTHVPWCMPGSRTSEFLWSRWRGKRSRHSRRMRNTHVYVSGNRPIEILLQPSIYHQTSNISLDLCR